MIPVKKDTLSYIQNEEGCRLKAYYATENERKRGICTIGYGMTRIYGRPVKITDELTQSEADALFTPLVQYYQDRVLAMINPQIRAKLKPQQITALVSLAYNIGLDENKNGIPEGFGDSTLLKKLNAGDFQGAADQFLQWTRAGNNKTLLKPRRERERKLFLS